MAKAKFYAVKNGKKIGIFETWEACKEQVHGYKGAEFKSFEYREDAVNYLNGNETKKEFFMELPKEDELIAFVDGSFNSKTNEYAFGVVLLNSKEEVLTFSGKDNREDVATMRNVAGELKGTMFICNYVVKTFPKIKSIKIYHDYEGIAKWVTGEWKCNLEYTQKYREFMLSLKEKINISFEKVAAHTGVEYNEQADKLAKEILGIK